MREIAIAEFVRQVIPLSRRAALLPLGAAGVAAALPSPVEAGKVSKKVKKKVKKTCKKQVSACRSTFLEFCLGFPTPPPGCLDFMEAEFGPCCDLMGSCNGAASTLCLLETAREAFTL